MTWYVTEHEWNDEMLDAADQLQLVDNTSWLTHDPIFEWTEEDLREFEHQRRYEEQLAEQRYMSFFEMAYGEPFKCGTWTYLERVYNERRT